METDDTREWYYELEGTRKGPISERRMRADFELDAMTSETLVWTSGMDDWQALGRIDFENLQNEKPTEIANQDAASSFEDPIVTCAFSGEQHPESQMLPFGEVWVSPEHREAFVQHLAESGESPDVPLEGYPFSTSFTLEAVLGQCFKIFGAQWKAIAIFCFSLYAPCYLVAEFLTYHVLTTEIVSPETEFGSFSILRNVWGPVFLGIGVELLLGSFVAAGIFSMARDRWNGRSELETGGLFQGGSRHFVSVLITRLLLFFIYFLIGGGLVLFIFSTDGFSLILPLAAIATVLFAFLGTRLTSGEALSVLIGRGGSAALQKSWVLTKGNFWKVLGFRLLVFIPIGVIGAVAGLIIEIPFPVFQNFVTSALITALITIPTAFGAIFELVLATHLKAKADAT